MKHYLFTLFISIITYTNCFSHINLDLALKEINADLKVKEAGVYSEAFKIPDILLSEEYIQFPERILEHANNKAKIYILNKLARNAWNISSQQSLIYARQALVLSKEISLNSALVLSLITMAETYLKMSDIELAKKTFQEALHLISPDGDREQLRSVYLSLSKIYLILDDKDKSLTSAQNALNTFKNDHTDKSAKDILINIGNIYYQYQDYNQAVYYYYLALDIETQQAMYQRLPLIYYNLALSYFQSGDFSQAQKMLSNITKNNKELSNKWLNSDISWLKAYLNYLLSNYSQALSEFNKALNIAHELKDFQSQVNIKVIIANLYLKNNDLQKAKDNYHSASEIAEKFSYLLAQAAIKNNLAIIDEMQAQYSDALNKHLLSLAQDKAVNNTTGVIISLYNLGNLYITLNQLNLSEDNLLQGLHLSLNTDERLLIMELNLALSNLYEKLENYPSALNYHRKYSDLKVDYNLQLLQTKFELGARRYEYEIIKQQNTILNLQKSRLYLGLFSLLILLMVMIFLYQARSRVLSKLKSEITRRQNTAQQLNHIKSDLELRVYERTKELKQLNDDLQNEVKSRIISQTSLESSLKEKEVLIKEIHHRVKNNMQVISSLLYMQAIQLEDHPLVSIFEDSYHRVKSMSLIHEKLYNSADLSRIDFHDYVKTLSSLLYKTYSPKAEIKFEIDMCSLLLDINLAIPCGLILNELLSNSLKYAFAGKTQGRINISLNLDTTHKYNLLFRDDGIGLKEKVNLSKLKTLGIRLVYLLAEEQLSGMVEISSNNGTTFKISFPGP
jgi:two-component sensor histidine kinase/tetratricopeptide (TPR) repeat protein